jgi:hypothetical protein
MAVDLILRQRQTRRRHRDQDLSPQLSTGARAALLPHGDMHLGFAAAAPLSRGT